MQSLNRRENCIYVRKGMNAQEIFQCLTPELALAGFADGDPEYDRNEDAFHAYCASYMLCKKYGIDTQAYDFSYAPAFLEGMEPQECGLNCQRPVKLPIPFLPYGEGI